MGRKRIIGTTTVKLALFDIVFIQTKSLPQENLPKQQGAVASKIYYREVQIVVYDFDADLYLLKMAIERCERLLKIRDSYPATGQHLYHLHTTENAVGSE